MTPVTPIEGATSLVTDQVSGLTGFITGTAGPALFGLAIAGIDIALGLKYVKRGANKA